MNVGLARPTPRDWWISPMPPDVSAAVALTDAPVDWPAVDEVQPRTDPAQLAELEVRLHGGTSRRNDGGGHREDPVGAMGNHG